MTRRTLFAALSMAALAQAVLAQQPAAPPALRSPEVSHDRRVTFRIWAPSAKAVSVAPQTAQDEAACADSADADGLGWRKTAAA